MRIHRLRSPEPGRRGGALLRALLLAALVPPALPALFGGAHPAPFGAPRALLRVVVGAMVLSIAARAWRRSVTLGRAAVRLALWLGVVAALAAMAAAVVARRATAFYTAQTLADTMAALLLVHLFGGVIDLLAPEAPADARESAGPDERAVAGRRRRRWRRMPEPSPTAATRLDGGAAALVAAFWAMAAVGLLHLAGVLLIAAGATVAVAAPVRFARAWDRSRTGERLRLRRRFRLLGLSTRRTT